MPTPTLVQMQNEMIQQVQVYFAAADILQDDFDTTFDEDLSTELDQEGEDDFSRLGDLDFQDPDAAEMLEFLGIVQMGMAASMSGDGSPGSYFQFSKSKDFFSCCLQSPDKEFWFYFRMGREMFDHLIYILMPNPLFQSTRHKLQ
ncbi:uncharacterized protein ARMOST_06969 [Armillaria ostoyae]|uniref:Uncharacterized protein n=1 Tax=Armillaria ostoyae TaxID=47428 RepID=A0A284R4H6_ARMOS|nr:uncharacterized protein ARMOST_06969 [Armillaria ostoyae]